MSGRSIVADGSGNSEFVTSALHGSTLFLVVCAVVAVFICRFIERECSWSRFRASTILWVGGVGLGSWIAVMESDSAIIQASCAVLCGVHAWQVWKRRDEVRRLDLLAWLGLVCLPVSGWILFHRRFPEVHAVAESSGGFAGSIG